MTLSFEGWGERTTRRWCAYDLARSEVPLYRLLGSISSLRTIMIVAALSCAVRSVYAAGGVMEGGPVGLVLPISGAALSAEQVEERSHMSDGKSVSQTLLSNIYRDREGRMRVEWRIDANGRESARVAYLIDPVAGSTYMLVIEAKLASRIGGPETGEFRVGFPAIGQPLPNRKWKVQPEQLRTRVIGGIEVDGSRTIRISEDEPPLTAREEVWRSQSLHLTVSVEASGPSWRHTAKLQNIDQHEPDRALFTIPPDFTIQE